MFVLLKIRRQATSLACVFYDSAQGQRVIEEANTSIQRHVFSGQFGYIPCAKVGAGDGGWLVCLLLAERESAKSKTCIIIHLQFEALCDNVACRVNVDVHIVAVFIANALPAIANHLRQTAFTTSRTNQIRLAVDVVLDPAAVRQSLKAQGILFDQ